MYLVSILRRDYFAAHGMDGGGVLVAAKKNCSWCKPFVYLDGSGIYIRYVIIPGGLCSLMCELLSTAPENNSDETDSNALSADAQLRNWNSGGLFTRRSRSRLLHPHCFFMGVSICVDGLESQVFIREHMLWRALLCDRLLFYAIVAHTCKGEVCRNYAESPTGSSFLWSKLRIIRKVQEVVPIDPCCINDQQTVDRSLQRWYRWTACINCRTLHTTLAFFDWSLALVQVWRYLIIVCGFLSTEKLVGTGKSKVPRSPKICFNFVGNVYDTSKTPFSLK